MTTGGLPFPGPLVAVDDVPVLVGVDVELELDFVELPHAATATAISAASRLTRNVLMLPPRWFTRRRWQAPIQAPPTPPWPSLASVQPASAPAAEVPVLGRRAAPAPRCRSLHRAHRGGGSSPRC